MRTGRQATMTAEDMFTPAGLVGYLAGGGSGVMTQVEQGGSNVYLRQEDVFCGSCGELIEPEDYPGAGFAPLLANLKTKYGETFCPDCLDDVRDE